MIGVDRSADLKTVEGLLQAVRSFPVLLSQGQRAALQLLRGAVREVDRNRFLTLVPALDSNAYGDVDVAGPLRVAGELTHLGLLLKAVLADPGPLDEDALAVLRELKEASLELWEQLRAALDAVQRLAAQGDEQRVRWRLLVRVLLRAQQGTTEPTTTICLPAELAVLRQLLEQALKEN